MREHEFLPREVSEREQAAECAQTAVLAVRLVGIMLLAANDVFRIDVPRIPVALLTTLAAGYLLRLAQTFRAIIGGIP